MLPGAREIGLLLLICGADIRTKLWLSYPVFRVLGKHLLTSMLNIINLTYVTKLLFLSRQLSIPQFM